MAKYNMTFEEAQEYISRRGFDIPWNDCDVFVDERNITQTVANVLKWADENPVKHTSDTDAFIEKAAEWLSEIENGTTITDIDKFVEDFKKYMEGE